MPRPVALIRGSQRGELWKHSLAWLRQARLQFQPMYFINYSVGAAAAYTTAQRFNVGLYELGFIVLFLGVLCAALTNDYYDYPTDRLNKNAGFTGGTRVLVEGKLGFSEVKAGILFVLGLIFVFGCLLMWTAKDISAFLILLVGLSGIFLLLEYTAPPLKFSWRGMGEIVVSMMTGPYPVLLGYILQIGTWTNSLPWLLSIPLFFAMFTAITLGGIPDYYADRTVSKKTISVIFGPWLAAIIALFLLSLTTISCLLLWLFNILKGPGSITVFIVIPYALILGLAIIKLIKSDDYDRPINKILQVAVFNIILIGLILLLSLLWQ